ERGKIEEQAQLLRCVEGTVKERTQPDENAALPLVPATPGAGPDVSAEVAKAQQVFTELFEERLACVEQFASRVADQRLHLAEQFERLAWLQLGRGQGRGGGGGGLAGAGAPPQGGEQSAGQSGGGAGGRAG